MKDILTNSNGDIAIAGNDIMLGRSNEQHQEHLLIAQKGSIKQYPQTGVGIEDYLNGDIGDMLLEIRKQFTDDGMTVNAIAYDEQTGDLTYDADYNS